MPPKTALFQDHFNSPKSMVLSDEAESTTKVSERVKTMVLTQLTYRLLARRKLGRVDGPLMPRQLVQQLAILTRPHNHSSIRRRRGNLLAVGVPAHAHQVLLHAGIRAVKCADMSLRRCKRTNVPRPDRRVHGVRDQ